MDAAVEFIRKYGKLNELDEEPYFGENGTMHPRFIDAMRYPELVTDSIASDIHMPDPEFLADYEKTRVQRAEGRLPEAGFLERIADSEENILIDLCSGLGKRITLPFARTHPKVAVFMYDNLSKEALSREMEEEKKAGYPNSLKLFDKGFEMSCAPETLVNRALDANGYENVTYIHTTLGHHRQRLDIYEMAGDPRVNVTGLLAPGGLGDVTAMIGNKMKAKMIVISNSAIGYINPNGAYLKTMKEYLRGQLSNDEINGVVTRLHDPGQDCPCFDEWEKYDYNIPGQRMFASALKLIYVLGQKHFLEHHGYSVEIFEMEPAKISPYNKPEHLLVALKKE